MTKAIEMDTTTFKYLECWNVRKVKDKQNTNGQAQLLLFGIYAWNNNNRLTFPNDYDQFKCLKVQEEIAGEVMLIIKS